MTETADRRRFRIVRCLGKGGFGEVYLAKMISAGGVRADVALKVLHTGLDPRSQAVQRIKDEARMLGLLNHPSILRIIDLILLDGRVSLVTEYVDGADLDTCVNHATDPLPTGPLLEVLARVAEALYVAYTTAGPDGRPLHLVHRDVKPSNIRIGRHGEVKLLDFGIAKATVEREAKTQTSAVLGSIPYLSPERFGREDEEGTPGDVYGLGVTLYECLAHRRLFDNLTPRQHFRLAMDDAAHDLLVQQRVADLTELPEPVRGLLHDLLAYDPADRPQLPTLGGRIEDLADAMAGDRLSRWCRRHAWKEEATLSGALSGRTLTEQDLSQSGVEFSLSDVPARDAVAIAQAMSAPSEPETWAVDDDDLSGLLADDLAPASSGAAPALFAAGLGAVGLGLIAVAVLLALGSGVGLYLAFQTGDSPVGAPEPAPVLTHPVAPVPRPDPSDTDGPRPSPSPSPPRTPGTPTPGPTPPPAEPAPVTPAPSAPSGGVDRCGDPIALEPPAVLGRLSSANRACLAAAMRDDGLSQTDRGKLGRVLLADASARCQAGSCSDYEREQAYFFEEIGRSDADMLYVWARHLAAAAGSREGRIKDARKWSLRALEEKHRWSGPDYVQRVDVLLGQDARLAHTLWIGSPSTERYRLDARNTSADWMAYRSQIGRDIAPALELCAAAWGSEEACRARTLDEIQRAAITFVTVPLGGAVFVDGVKVGDAPVVVQVDHGEHQLRVEVNGSGGDKTISVGVNSPTRWTYRAAEGSWESAF
ncbi:MAG: serine/threonine protein kinase [Myxococcota bacterium]